MKAILLDGHKRYEKIIKSRMEAGLFTSGFESIKTGEVCDGCNAKGRLSVQVGDDSGYDTNTAYLCRECAKEAWLLIKDTE